MATNHSYMAGNEFRASPRLPVVLLGLLVGVIPVAWALIAVAVVAFLTSADLPSATGDVLKEYPTLGLFEKRYW